VKIGYVILEIFVNIFCRICENNIFFAINFVKIGYYNYYYYYVKGYYLLPPGVWQEKGTREFRFDFGAVFLYGGVCERLHPL
jgi:hypothetical protein